ncbi:MAG: GntR family transcriptional regulator of gluconate operon [Verrucomicrobiales bacterium]|jgi:GntR family transcriptional regulator of gluconate operon
MAIDTPRPDAPVVVRLELRDAVTTMLREMIFRGEFQTGERLVETDLAARFGTSRGPVRDAFAELEQVGLLVSGRGKGTYVRELNTVDVDELYTLRQSLELLAIKRATERLGKDDLDNLRAHAEAIDEALVRQDAVGAGDADMAFHRTILKLADHGRLLAAWERLADQTRLLMQALTQVSPEYRSHALDHSSIVDALASGDPLRAEDALRTHLGQARASIIRAFAALEAGS